MKASKTGERLLDERLTAEAANYFSVVYMSQSQVTYLIYIYSFKKPLCVCLSVNHTIHFIVNTTSKHAVTHTQRLSAVQCAEVKMGFIFGAN